MSVALCYRLRYRVSARDGHPRGAPDELPHERYRQGTVDGEVRSAWSLAAAAVRRNGR